MEKENKKISKDVDGKDLKGDKYQGNIDNSRPVSTSTKKETNSQLKSYLEKEETKEQVFEEQVKAREESAAAAENIDNVTDPDGYVKLTTGTKQIEPTEKEKQDIKEALNDTGYLQHTPEAVGYANRQLQFLAYGLIAQHIPPDESVLDFGCGRGDFERYYQQNYNKKLDYIGVDMNQPLIEAGKTLYEGKVNLKCSDWFKLDDNLKQDWSINVASNNLRYDADSVTDDEYLKSTIKCMHKHANKGIIILLTSTHSKVQDGLINYNPGDLLNWAQQELGYTALDHTASKDGFVLLIYKRQN